MLTSFQWRWGVAQWVEFLKDKEIPVLLRTQALIQALASLDAASTEAISARELAGYVFADPYLSLKLLRYVNHLKHFPQPIASFRQAASSLGHSQLKRFVALIAATSAGHDKSAELYQMSLIRARFCELLAQSAR